MFPKFGLNDITIKSQHTMSKNLYLPPTLQPDNVYHLFSHAVDNNNLFYENHNYTFFLNKWAHYSKNYFRTYAFCLMPNHFHFCVQALPVSSNKLIVDMPSFSTNLQTAQLGNYEPSVSYHSRRLSHFLSSYAQSLNRKRNRKGVLFRSTFGRVQVTNADYFKDLICYIHHNPIHHFDVASYQDWHYSSYDAYAPNYDKTWSFLDTPIVTNRFGSSVHVLDYHEKYKTNRQFTKIEETVVQYYKQYG
jgi:putative transposase